MNPAVNFEIKITKPVPALTCHNYYLNGELVAVQSYMFGNNYALRAITGTFSQTELISIH